MSGSIPPEIGSLTSLQDFYLFNNQLTDSIPAELGNLTNLELLRLQNNQLSGEVPTSFHNLTSLSGLDLSCNSGLTISNRDVLDFVEALDPDWDQCECGVPTATLTPTLTRTPGP